MTIPFEPEPDVNDAAADVVPENIRPFDLAYGDGDWDDDLPGDDLDEHEGIFGTEED